MWKACWWSVIQSRIEGETWLLRDLIVEGPDCWGPDCWGTWLLRDLIVEGPNCWGTWLLRTWLWGTWLLRDLIVEGPDCWGTWLLRDLINHAAQIKHTNILFIYFIINSTLPGSWAFPGPSEQAWGAASRHCQWSCVSFSKLDISMTRYYLEESLCHLKKKKFMLWKCIWSDLIKST